MFEQGREEQKKEKRNKVKRTLKNKTKKKKGLFCVEKLLKLKSEREKNCNISFMM